MTDLAKDKQGASLLLSLGGEAQEAALRVPKVDLIKDDGAEKVILELDKLYLKDETLRKFHALDKLETFKRPSSMTIHQYLIDFDNLVDKTKSHGVAWPEDILAYRLLKNANLSEHNERLAKATIEKLEYSIVKSKLKSIFGDSENPLASANIKMEEIEFAGAQGSGPVEDGDHEQDVAYTFYNNRGFDSYNRSAQQPQLPWKRRQSSKL